MKIPSKQQISENRRLLQNQYAFLDGEGGFDAAPKNVETSDAQISNNRLLLGNQYAFIDGAGQLSAEFPKPLPSIDLNSEELRMPPKQSRSGERWIEAAVRNLQKRIWRRRYELWPDGVPDDPVELLDPAVALNLAGFKYEMVETLGQFSNYAGTFEVAGIINRSTKSVGISRQLPFNTRRFTTAHELAHAVLHEDVHMHRDRPLDGSAQVRGVRDRVEKEADKFASLFLMPENLLRKRFRQFFLCDKFALNEDTIFALDPAGSMRLQDRNKTLRELTRIIANTDSYNGVRFQPLADQFYVSVEAMAIRLEELVLVEV